MANWYGMSRTNYFRVKNETAFRAWVDTLLGVALIDDGDGEFGFYAGGNGGWPQLRHDEASDTWNEFNIYEELAPHLADDEVAILITVGHENPGMELVWRLRSIATGKCSKWTSATSITWSTARGASSRRGRSTDWLHERSTFTRAYVGADASPDKSWVVGPP